MFVGVKDYSMFKSAETGKSMKKPKKVESDGLKMFLPPIIRDKMTAESLES